MVVGVKGVFAVEGDRVKILSPFAGMSPFPSTCIIYYGAPGWTRFYASLHGLHPNWFLSTLRVRT